MSNRTDTSKADKEGNAMKKILAMMLALTLALLCTGAYADEAVKLNENNDKLEFYLNIPNGMSLEQIATDPGVVGSIEIAGMPDLYLVCSLMPDDSYTGMDMAELTAEDIQALSGMVTEDLGESTQELYDMPCGLKAMEIRDTANTEYIAMTLKDGYFFYINAFHDDFSPLSEDEIAAAKSAFDCLSYEEITK